MRAIRSSGLLGPEDAGAVPATGDADGLPMGLFGCPWAAGASALQAPHSSAARADQRPAACPSHDASSTIRRDIVRQCSDGGKGLLADLLVRNGDAVLALDRHRQL